MGVKARTTFCPHCETKGRRSLIDLTPPYLCPVCGYSMVERRCIDYRKNTVTHLAEKTHESVMVLFGTSTQVKALLDMRRLGLINMNGDLTPKGRELVNKAAEAPRKQKNSRT